MKVVDRTAAYSSPANPSLSSQGVILMVNLLHSGPYSFYDSDSDSAGSPF